MAISIQRVLQKANRFAKKGKFEQAAEPYRSVLEAFPNNKRALDGLKTLGQASRGVPQRGFASQRPHMPDQGQLNQLIGLYNQGEYTKALTLCEELAKKFPRALMVFNILGAINAAMGELEPAVAAYNKARELDPNVAEIHNNLGLALIKLERNQEAVDSFRNAIRLKPNYAGAYNNLGLAICELGNPSEAIDCYLKALKFQPDYAEVYNNIGLAQDRLHLHDKALISYEKAININADIADAHKNKGNAFILMGKNIEALECLKEALKLNSNIPDMDLLCHLSQIPPQLIDFDISSVLENFQSGQINDYAVENMNLAFIKATLLHNAGHHLQAWDSLLVANQSHIELMGNDFPIDMEKQRDSLQRLKGQIPTAQSAEVSNKNLPISLFLLGPSRSGKSTLERLTASSPKVETGYESSIIESAIFSTCDEAGLSKITNLDELPDELQGSFKKHYLDILENFVKSDQIFTMTAPDTIQHINRAVEMLPNIRMVFVKRDIDDNILRIFMKRYQSLNSYAYNIEYIKEYLDWYNEMIDILHELHPQISAVIQYEDMVSEPENTLEIVSDLCGAELSVAELPPLGDDRNCSQPYLEWMSSSR